MSYVVGQLSIVDNRELVKALLKDLEVKLNVKRSSLFILKPFFVGWLPRKY